MNTTIQTKKKNLVNIDELNAYKVAYESKLQAKDYLTYVGVPAIGLGIFSFILFYYWWVTIIMIGVGALYGLTFYLPKSIKKQYSDHSFNQRNKFLNNMTQLLTDENKTVTRALLTANERANGEFQTDIQVLQARLMGADNFKIGEGFAELCEKYESDIIFVQYIEQLETAMLEGRANIDTLKDIKTYHNDMKRKQNEYEKQKEGHLKDMKMLAFVVITFILAITFSFGMKTYVNAFAHHFTGWITLSIYLSLMGYFFKQFSRFLFDDSILEVEK